MENIGINYTDFGIKFFMAKYEHVYSANKHQNEAI